MARHPMTTALPGWETTGTEEAPAWERDGLRYAPGPAGVRELRAGVAWRKAVAEALCRAHGAGVTGTVDVVLRGGRFGDGGRVAVVRDGAEVA